MTALSSELEELERGAAQPKKKRKNQREDAAATSITRTRNAHNASA